MEIFSIATVYKPPPVSVCLRSCSFLFSLLIHLQKSLVFPPIRLTISTSFLFIHFISFHFSLSIQSIDRSNGYFVSWALWLFGMQTNFFVCKVSILLFSFFSAQFKANKGEISSAFPSSPSPFLKVNFENIGANKYQTHNLCNTQKREKTLFLAQIKSSKKFVHPTFFLLFILFYAFHI